MVNGKQAISLMEQAAKYVQACGKRSILECKPQSFKGLNISELHFVPQLESDILQINPIFKEFMSKISKAKDSESLTILGNEIDKLECLPEFKKLLSSRYLKQFESFYVNKYANVKISPQNIFKNIFGKDLSETELTELCNKYQSILKEPNLEKFIAKLYMQVKNDYGLAYLKPNIQLNRLCGSGLAVRGGMYPQNRGLKLTYFEDNPINRFKIFTLFMHEFRHAKQTEIAIASNLEKYIEAYSKRLAKQNPQMTLEQCKEYTIKKLDNDMLENIKRIYGDVDKNSNLYKQGMSYIESMKNYFAPKEFTSKGFLEYKQQLIEKEAYSVQDQAAELYYYLNGKIVG